MVRSEREYRWPREGARMSAVQSVLTATRVLERLSEPGLVGVSELSRDLGLPKSSVQRMLLTLKEAGWAEDVRGETTRWTLTPKMFRLGQHHHARNGLRSTALPVMEQLRDATRETVHLVVQRDDSVVVVECLDSPQPVRAHVDPGDVLPLHASTNGRALLSTQSEQAVRDLISRGLRAYTPQTVTDPVVFEDIIRQARARGYAAGVGQFRDGVHAVAAPIVVGGVGIASIGVSTPAQRMTPELEETFGKYVIDAARTIAGHFGEDL
jgi:IclR family acetate operon transcriptional repressor